MLIDDLEVGRCNMDRESGIVHARGARQVEEPLDYTLVIGSVHRSQVTLLFADASHAGAQTAPRYEASTNAVRFRGLLKHVLPRDRDVGQSLLARVAN